MYLENGKFLKRGGAIVCTKQFSKQSKFNKVFSSERFLAYYSALKTCATVSFFKPLPLRLL